MAGFKAYAEKYSTIKMQRRDGILEVRFHTEGGPLRWGKIPHSEFPNAFADISRDRENRVVIITGTGNEFSGPQATAATASFTQRPTVERVDRVHWESRALIMNLLSIDCPVIAAINGPAWRHAEIPLLSDVILAAEHAAFQDSAHFISDMVPGDGMHVVFPLLFGMNRGRYALLTGQTISAHEAQQMGVVAEVLTADQVMVRAWELAEQLACKPILLLRHTRLLFTEYLKRQMQDLLGYGLALENLAFMEKPETV